MTDQVRVIVADDQALATAYESGRVNYTDGGYTDIPALVGLAGKTGSPLAGKDLKTGQTLIKTIIAPGLKARLLGVGGLFGYHALFFFALRLAPAAEAQPFSKPSEPNAEPAATACTN